MKSNTDIVVHRCIKQLHNLAGILKLPSSSILFLYIHRYTSENFGHILYIECVFFLFLTFN